MFTSFEEKINKFYGNEIIGILHIGAHYGREYAEYTKMNIPNIIFFEPLPHVFEELKKNVPLEYIVNKGVGNFNGQIEMYVESANEGQSSSMLKPKVHINLYPSIVFNSTQTVDVVKLDDYISDYSKYNVLNIDTQGYELEVLKGSHKLLNNIDVINIEVNNAELYEGCPIYTDIDSFLESYGFERKLIEWWENMPWGDALYVKSKIAIE